MNAHSVKLCSQIAPPPVRRSTPRYSTTSALNSVRRNLKLALLWLLVNAASQLSAGTYSRHATVVWGKEAPVHVSSPNREMVLVGKVVKTQSDFYVRLSLLKGSRQLWKQRISPGVGLEVLWAPDSRAFSVTSSHHGANGWFDTHIFVIDADEFVQEVDVTAPVLQAFGDPVECAWPE